MFDVAFRGTGNGRLDIKNLAGLIESDSGTTAECTATFLAGVVFSGSLGLFIGLGEGAAEDPSSGDDDLGNDAVRLNG